MVKLFKLQVLKSLFIVLLTILGFATKRKRFFWLRHYLLGSGRGKVMLSNLLDLGMVRRGCINKKHHRTTSGGCVFKLWSTTMYEGMGFWGRPEMFYMVGCMSIDVKHDGNHVIVSGSDVFDWHPADEEGNYYTSPLPSRFIPVLKVMGKIFGEEYFTECGFPMGQPGISNKLFEDFQLVGAKPFTTTFEVVIRSNEWRRLRRKILRDMY